MHLLSDQRVTLPLRIVFRLYGNRRQAFLNAFLKWRRGGSDVTPGMRALQLNAWTHVASLPEEKVADQRLGLLHGLWELAADAACYLHDWADGKYPDVTEAEAAKIAAAAFCGLRMCPVGEGLGLGVWGGEGRGNSQVYRRWRCGSDLFAWWSSIGSD